MIIEVKIEMGEMESVEQAVEHADIALSKLKTEGTWVKKLTFTPNLVRDEGGWLWDVLLEATWQPPRKSSEDLGEMVVGNPAKIAQQWGGAGRA